MSWSPDIRVEILHEFSQPDEDRHFDAEERYGAFVRARRRVAERARLDEERARLKILRKSRPKIFIPPHWRCEMIRARHLALHPELVPKPDPQLIADTVGIYRCTWCGNLGHNARTCVVQKAGIASIEMQKLSRQQIYRRRHLALGLCGECPLPLYRGGLCEPHWHWRRRQRAERAA